MYFCMIAVILLPGFRLVARSIHVVRESPSGICGVGARGLSPSRTFIEVPRELGMDPFQNNSVREVENVARLSALDKSLTFS